MSDFNHEWHVAINKFAMPRRGEDWPRFMYDAKEAYAEPNRLAILFERERTGKLRKVHKQCSLSPTVSIPENYLSCCMGKKCKECEFLAAIDQAEITPEEQDTAKAWTCVTHILQNGGDVAGEGFLLTVDDRMFWDNVYESMSYDPENEEKEEKP